MIVDSMTDQELLKEIIRDWEKTYDKIVSLSLNKFDKVYKKYIIKNLPSHLDKPIYFKPIVFNNSNGFEYTIINFTYGKHQLKKTGGVLTHNVKSFFMKGQRYVVDRTHNINSNYNNLYQIFTSHFFDRYKERFLKDNTLSRTEVLAKFFKGNNTYSITPLENPKYKNSVYCLHDDGVLLGERRDGFYLFKTFISKDLLGEDQNTLNNKIDQELEDIRSKLIYKLVMK